MSGDETLPGSSSRALSGRSETDEPALSSTNASLSPKPNAPPPVPASTNSAPLRTASFTTSAASPAMGMSPRTSRNSSPMRKDKPPPLAGPLSTQPSAAAIQRALSASSIPQLQHSTNGSETISRLPRGPKNGHVSGDSSPQWPISPRLKSPPPSAVVMRKGSATIPNKKSESSGGSAVHADNQLPPKAPSPPPAKQGNSDMSKTEATPQVPTPLPKGPSRGPGGKSTLETVQENSADSVAEPSPAAIRASADLHPLTKISEETVRGGQRDRARADPERNSQAGESGSESAGNRSDHRRGRRPSANNNSNPGAQRPKQANPKNSYPTMASAKSRQGDGKQNMTVETETVQSIPQSALTTSDRFDHTGSVKLKASTETIRPRKERKKAERKARSLNQGTVPSKADLFEARVANAVDEANSSDSEETFVYESNPPEPQRRQRHHSRTPSVTSSHSVAEQPRGSIRHHSDAHDEQRIRDKRSMKFFSVYNDVDSPESKDGSVRSHTPRHLARSGRGGHHHPIQHNQDSPATTVRGNHLSVPRPSRPTSPRSPRMASQFPAQALFGKKQEHSFDLDAEGADDERTPLMNANRSRRHVRNMHMRPIGAGPMYAVDEHLHVNGRRRWWHGGTSACLLTLLVAILVMASALSFVFVSSRPLYDVRIRRVQNVLATEQELMLDLVVSAVNPNALGIIANKVDIIIFAKSKHAGDGHGKDDGTQTSILPRTRRLRRNEIFTTDVQYNPSPSQDLSGHWHAPDPLGHDHGTDPDPDTDPDHSKDAAVQLGNVCALDQALAFAASPFKRETRSTIGSLRLKKPGNNTVPGGSERWEKMIQYPFELIIRGVLQYQLPISSRWLTSQIEGAVMVHPEEGINRHGSMRVEPIDTSERWQWIDWPADEDDVNVDEPTDSGLVVDAT